jgi:5-methyltetrahydropteroyltriglutamate--homocysteine methyltransferase
VQIDEPYMQARPEEARAFGLKALNQALDGVNGTTAVHICFGYAAIIHARPSGYSFLGELAGCSCKQVSLETAQSKLDCRALTPLTGKKARIRRALPYVAAEDIILAPDCGMKYLPRETALGKLKAMVAGAAIVRTELSRAA